MTSTNIKKPNRAKIWFRETGPYIRLRTILTFKSQKPKTVKEKVLEAILIVFVAALALTLCWYLFKALTNGQQTVLIKPADISILLFTVEELFILIYAIVAQAHRLQNPEDCRIIITFPLSNAQRYTGEIIAIFVKILVYNFAIFWPIHLIYIISTGLISASAFFLSMYAALTAPFLPFAISIIVAIPFIYLAKVLKNKKVAKIILSCLVFAIVVVLYCLVLAFMADWYVHTKSEIGVMEGIKKLLTDMNHWYNPAWWASRISLNYTTGWLMWISLAISVALAAIGFCASYPVYKSLVLSETNEGLAKARLIKCDGKNAYRSTYEKEFKHILRTPSYAYFFIGIALCMPILTYMIINIVKKMGESKVGPETFFGLSLLVVMSIVSLISSFSANSISREQSQLYISKTAPIDTRRYLLSKTLVVFTLSAIGLALCIAVLASTSLKPSSATSKAVLTPVNLTALTLTTFIFLIGSCFNGMNVNLVRPRINLVGPADESNIGIQLAINMGVTIIFSAFALFVSSLMGDKEWWVYVILLCAAIIYTLVNFLVFWFTAEKKFSKIEMK